MLRYRPKASTMSEKYTAAQFARDTEHYLSRFNAHPQLCHAQIPADLNICVTVPCINEPDVITSLESLYACTPPEGTVEIIVLINASDTASEQILAQNELTRNVVNAWIGSRSETWIHTQVAMVHGLARKHAGAGWARKLAMDEALRHFASAGNADGIIAGFDADAVCSSNYLTELERLFSDTSVSGCSIYFEHRLDSTDYTAQHTSAIQHYELHLRYLTHAMRWAGAPYAYHTVGSSMAVRVRDYIKIGGMNRRTAGEDFYFLHKIIPRGRFANLGTATVFPSSRISDRVPFGTGAAMRLAADAGEDDFMTYRFASFKGIKQLFAAIDSLYNTADTEQLCRTILQEDIGQYLLDCGIVTEIAQIKANCASLSSFRTRFVEWFNAFRLIKYLNWAHTGKYKRSGVAGESALLLGALEIAAPETAEKMLQIYRTLDRKEF